MLPCPIGWMASVSGGSYAGLMPQFDTDAQPGEPEWWQILAARGPWILLLGFFLVCFIWWLAARQDAKSAERQKLWRRAEWALDASLDEDPKRQRTGHAVLDLLGSRIPAGSDEARIFAEVVRERPARPDCVADTDRRPR